MSFDESVCVKEKGRRRGSSRLIAANVPLVPCPFNLPGAAKDNQEVNHESIKGSSSQGSFQTGWSPHSDRPLEAFSQSWARVGMGDTKKYQLKGRSTSQVGRTFPVRNTLQDVQNRLHHELHS